MRPASIWRPAATSGLSPAFPGSRRIRRTSFEARDYGAGFSFLARLSEPTDTPRLHVKAGDAHLRWPRVLQPSPPSQRRSAGKPPKRRKAACLTPAAPSTRPTPAQLFRGARPRPRLKRPTARARCFTWNIRYRERRRARTAGAADAMRRPAIVRVTRQNTQPAGAAPSWTAPGRRARYGLRRSPRPPFGPRVHRLARGGPRRPPRPARQAGALVAFGPLQLAALVEPRGHAGARSV